MKVSELSERSGLTVQTIKFYIREGLLPKGVAASATRAEYAERHLERLRLIRALREVGELPIASIKHIIEALDDERVGLHALFGTAAYALGPQVDPRPEDPAWQAARQDVDALIDELDWQVTSEAPARDLLTQAVVALRGLGFEVTPDKLRPYVAAATRLAEHEAGGLKVDAPRTEAVHAMIVSTVLYERVLAALHRLAQEDASARRFTQPS